MRRVLALPLALVLASCGTGGSVKMSTARDATPAELSGVANVPLRDLAIGSTAPAGVGPGVMGSFPQDGVFTYQPDPRCGASSNIFPDLQTAVCMRSKAIEYVTREVIAGRVAVGPTFRACSYPSDPAWSGCIEYTLRNATPEIRWAQSPVWVKGAIEGVPWEGCAAGLSVGPFIRVSFADPARTMRLVSWETGNVMLLTLDRYTATDGPIVGAATDYAAQACGVN